MTKQEKPAPHGVGFLFAASRNLERRSVSRGATRGIRKIPSSFARVSAP
jgi:hypothetical protein